MDTKVIYVRLMDEGTDVFRPTKAEPVGDNLYILLPTQGYDPADEKWEFPPYSKVGCKKEIINNKIEYVAIMAKNI